MILERGYSHKFEINVEHSLSTPDHFPGTAFVSYQDTAEIATFGFQYDPAPNGNETNDKKFSLSLEQINDFFALLRHLVGHESMMKQAVRAYDGGRDYFDLDFGERDELEDELKSVVEKYLGGESDD